VSAHVQERLSVYLDGELPQTERAEVDAHLRGCAACARHLEELAAVDAAARDLPVPAPPGYFDSLPARVAARLPAPRTRRPQPQTWVWAAAAAALALAVLTPLTVRRTTSPLPEAARSDETERFNPAPPATAAEAPPDAAGGARELARDTSKDVGRARPAPTVAPLASGRLQEKAMAPPPPPPPAPAVQAQRHAGPFAQQQNQAPAAAAPAPAAEAIDAVAESAARHEEEQKEEAPKLKKQAGPAGKSDRDQASAGALADTAASAPGFAQAPGEDGRYRALLTRRPSTLEAARKLRDDWQAFVRAYPDGPRADEARVRALEAQLAAYRTGGERADLERLRADANTYLKRSDAAQPGRVRAMLAEAALSPEP
jgi:predicted anti-sigma-YlaC factor YlaD